jgi:hypothetical protein
LEGQAVSASNRPSWTGLSIRGSGTVAGSGAAPAGVWQPQGQRHRQARSPSHTIADALRFGPVALVVGYVCRAVNASTVMPSGPHTYVSDVANGSLSVCQQVQCLPALQCPDGPLWQAHVLAAAGTSLWVLRIFFVHTNSRTHAAASTVIGAGVRGISRSRFRGR